MTSGATQNAVHTVRRRRLKNRPIFSCTSLYLAGVGILSSLPNTAIGMTADGLCGLGAGCQAGAGPTIAVAITTAAAISAVRTRLVLPDARTILRSPQPPQPTQLSHSS